MQKVTVTGELRKLLTQQGFKVSTVFSDTRKPKGVEKAVGAKFCRVNLTAKQEAKIKTAMENLGFKCHYITYNAGGCYGGWSRGTRFCFSKK